MTTFVIKDKNLVPENIKKGVTILKVTGTLESGGRVIELQSKTVDSSTEKQTVTYDSGYDGLKDVTVEAYELDAKTVNSSTTQQVITSDKDGLSSVTVNPYTLDTKTVDASTVSQTVNSSADGLSSVTVNPYTLETDSSTLTDNGTYVFVPSHANGISQLTIDVSVEGSSSDSSVYQNAFGITQSPDMRSAAPRCIMTDHVIDNANFVGMSGYIAAPYSQNPYWVFGVDCDVQTKAPAAPKFGIFVNGDDMTFYFGETDGLTVSNEDTDFQSGAYFNVYEDSDTGDHIVEVNGVTYDYEEETGLGWMSNSISNELYIFANNSNGTANGIAPEGTFFQSLILIYNDGESDYTCGFDAAVEGSINEGGFFDGETPALYYWDDGDEGIIHMPSGYSYNVISTYDAVANNDVIWLSEGGDSELVMFNPTEGRPAGVVIPVPGSGGGDTWFVQAKRGEISDVAAYSFDGLEAMEYGAAYACAGSDIETYPELTFGEASQPQRSLKSDMKSGVKAPALVVANHGLEGAFRSCSELYNDDAVITINGSVGDYALGHIFAESHVNDVTIDVSTIGGEKAFENAFTNAVVDGDIVVTASEITNSFAYAFQNVNWNNDGRRWGTVSFPNLDTITGGYAFDQAFYESYFETVSFPSLDTFEEYSLSQMFNFSHVGKLIAHPAMFCYSYDASPIFDDGYRLTEIELSDTATNDMYFLWQPELSSASVYSILSNLSDQDPHTVTFWGDYQYDEEQGEDVLVNNLKVYDYPDNRILGALNDAESAGWVIENLTIYPASSVDYITTGHTDSTKLEIPGIDTKNTVLEADAKLKTSGDTWTYWINGGTSASGNRWSLCRSSSSRLYIGDPSTSGSTISSLSLSYTFRYNMRLGVRSDNYLWATNKLQSASSWTTYTQPGAQSPYTPSTNKLTLNDADWYSLKQWEGWDDTSTGGNSKVLVHDYVPVSYYNSVDDVTEYGLFDTVEAKFYTNSGITGTSER